ncbi:MAG: type IV pilus secretin PilQ [Bacteriovoracia bacterium]
MKTTLRFWLRICFIVAMLALVGVQAIGQESAQVPDPEEGAFEPPAQGSTDANLDSGTTSVDTAVAEVGGSAEVNGVDFKYAEGQSRLEISLNGITSFEKTVSEADKQVIIDIKNAKIAGKYARKLDTSSFNTNVSIVSPYQSNDSVRVVLQLKDLGNVEVSQEGQKVVALIDNGTGASSTTASTDTTADNTQLPGETAAAGPTDTESLDSFFQAQQEQKYVGKKISLQLRDADMKDVFRVISEASEFNIVLTEEVKGHLTINLVDVPWDQALDIILKSNRLAAERNGNVLRVTTISDLTKEKEAEVAAKKAAESAEPLVVKIFPVSYAKIDDLKKVVEDFLSKENLPSSAVGTSGTPVVPGSTLPKRGSIQIESRTNSLVVRDTPSTIEKIKRILKELDTQTPQILIEAKFVEVKESNSKQLQGRLFATSREYDSTTNGLVFNATNNNFGGLFAGSTFGGQTLPTSFSVSPVPGAALGFSPRAGLLPGLSEIGALLSILETEATAKIVASPRVVTQNKEAAEISQGTTIQLPTPTGANAAGGYVTVNAVLKLVVTPQVTNDGSVTMKINFSQDTISAQTLGTDRFSTDTKKVDSTVLVDSGATLVIGGIYSSSILESEAGIPILRDLPLIGPLFGSKESKVDKNELFIFLTPRVLNEKEAGLRG